MSDESRIRGFQRTLSPWLIVAFFLIVISVVSTISWAANRGHSRSMSSHGEGMRHANLTSAIMVGVELAGSSLEGAILEMTNLSNSDLRSADLSWTNGKNAVFRNACLRDTTWKESTLVSIELDGSDLRGADFRKSSVSITSARGAIADDTTRWGPIAVPAGTVNQPGDDPPCD